MYSLNDYMPKNYAICYGYCDTPWGACYKQTINEPWISSYNTMRGPGG